MKISRRSFLTKGSKLGFATLVSCGIGRVALAQERSSPPLGTGIGNVVPKDALNDPLFGITRAMFTQHLNTRFSFRLGPVKLGDMVLVAVEDMNPPTYKSDGTAVRDCFSVMFRGPGDLPLQQGTYTVGHRRLGSFDLLIVPGGESGLGRQYSAVINRLYP
jgi:hypothetical protein